MFDLRTRGWNRLQILETLWFREHHSNPRNSSNQKARIAPRKFQSLTFRPVRRQLPRLGRRRASQHSGTSLAPRSTISGGDHRCLIRRPRILAKDHVLARGRDIAMARHGCPSVSEGRASAKSPPSSQVRSVAKTSIRLVALAALYRNLFLPAKKNRSCTFPRFPAEDVHHSSAFHKRDAISNPPNPSLT